MKNEKKTSTERESVPATPADLSSIANEIQGELSDGASIAQEHRTILAILERHFGAGRV